MNQYNYNPYSALPQLQYNAQDQLAAFQQQQLQQQSPQQSFDHQRQQLEIEFTKTDEGAKLFNALQEGFTRWRNEKQGIKPPVDYSTVIEEQKQTIAEMKREIDSLKTNQSLLSNRLTKNTTNAQTHNGTQ